MAAKDIIKLGFSHIHQTLIKNSFSFALHIDEQERITQIVVKVSLVLYPITSPPEIFPLASVLANWDADQIYPGQNTASIKLFTETFVVMSLAPGTFLRDFKDIGIGAALILSSFQT